MQNTIPSRTNEPVQNAIDSCDKGVPNTVTVDVGVNKGDIPLVVQDHGPDGIMKNHGGQIMKFIEAQKGISTKPNKERKGIGMSQYVEIAPYVKVATRSRSFMHTFSMIPHPQNRELLAFCNVQNHEMTEINFNKYFLSKPGTRVEFHTQDDEPLRVNIPNLRKTLSEKWAYRLYDSRSYLKLFVNGKLLETTDEIEEHPPRFICALKGGFKVSGAIWPDPDGNGNCKLFVNGYLLEVGSPWGARQFRAYFNCDALATNSARNEIERDPIWYDFKAHIEPLIKIYRQSDQPKGIEIDKLKEFVKEHAVRALGKLLPRMTLPPRGKNPDGTTSTGNKILDGYIKSLDTNAVPGYPTPQDPDPTRVKQTRAFNGRNDENEGHIEPADTDDNDDKQGTQKKKKRKSKHKKDKESPLELIALEYDADKPLYIIQQHRPDAPVTFMINLSNEELAMLGIRRYAEAMMGQWMGELKRYLESRGTDEIVMDDEERMIYSRMRVEQWRSMGIYPQTESEQKAAKMLRDLLKKEREREKEKEIAKK
jgi:hypothetical protein